MHFCSHRSRLSRIIVLLASTTMPGCGGSSHSTPVSVQIDWAARSRGIGGPSSALSAAIVVVGANPNGGNIVFIADRPEGPAAVSRTYTSTISSSIGSFPVIVYFNASRGATGGRVGTAYTTLTVLPNGVTSVARVAIMEGTVQAVTIPPDQTIRVGETKNIVVLTDLAIPLEPGSLFWAVLQGGDHLRITDSLANGLSPGTAVVTVTIDGVTSEPQSVTVLPP